MGPYFLPAFVAILSLSHRNYRCPEHMELVVVCLLDDGCPWELHGGAMFLGMKT